MNVVRDFFSIQESIVRPHGFGNFCDGPHETKKHLPDFLEFYFYRFSNVLIALS